MPGLEAVEEHRLSTPFGDPSAPIITGALDGVPVAFLARHGRGHTIPPSTLPQLANFWALKKLGVERVLAVSAVGSLREDLRPGRLVAPDQFIDRTHGRPSSFFGDGAIAHIAFAEPVCHGLAAATRAAAEAAQVPLHSGGTYVVMEGPAFSTRAESQLHRSWGASLIGMTALPEAKLAREAELCYALVACVTDYDAWRDETEPVDAATVFATMARNVASSQQVVRQLVRVLPSRDLCACRTALDAALVTAPDAVGGEARQRLAPILDRRLRAAS